MNKKDYKRGCLASGLTSVIKLIILIAIIIIGINVFVIKATQDQIAATIGSRSDTLTDEELAELKELDADCIMVLGASVHPDGTPSPMLQDRLDTGIQLYHAGAAPKLLLTGDDGQEEYNEVVVMREYAINKGVDEEDIFLDHAGFSTYESSYRAKEVFDVDKIIIVTQEYHLYRALYTGRALGMEVLGAAANQETYRGQSFREIREILARDKDFAMCIIKPEPTFLGDTIPINGNGISTH